MEDMSEGRMVFGLQTGHPREDYEDPQFQLVVTMKIKHTAPWWKRLWNRLMRRQPKPWEQQKGYHYRSDDNGSVRKVTDPDYGYTPKEKGAPCPHCENAEFQDHSSFEEGLGGGVKVLTCTRCNRTSYYEDAVEKAG
jgi:hypothetical protein